MQATTFRVRQESIQRVDALSPHIHKTLGSSPQIAAAGVPITRSYIIRLAMLQGLEMLEAKYLNQSANDDKELMLTLT